MEIKVLNELLGRYIPLEEMAIVNDTIEVNNEDITNEEGEVQEKFAHFHWVYKRKAHFKFSNRIPKNVSELKMLFAFKTDAKLLSDKELGKVVKDLKSVITQGTFKGKTTFEGAKLTWIKLHPNRNLEQEIVNLD